MTDAAPTNGWHRASVDCCESLATPDRADPERRGEGLETAWRRDPCEYHNHEKYGCPLGLIGDLARETLARHDELEASGWVMEPIPEEVRATLTPPPAGNEPSHE